MVSSRPSRDAEKRFTAIQALPQAKTPWPIIHAL